MQDKILNLVRDFVIAAISSYLALMASGADPVDSLWSLLAGALYGALQALNPRYDQYGLTTPPE